MTKRKSTKKPEEQDWEKALLRREALAMQRIRYMCKRKGTEPPTRPTAYTCESCRRPRGAHGRGIAYDHCHRTKKFRGWLCGSCNMGLGLLGDTYMSVKRMLTYLERSRR